MQETVVKLRMARDMVERRKILQMLSKKQLQKICKILGISDHGHMSLLMQKIHEKF